MDWSGEDPRLFLFLFFLVDVYSAVTDGYVFPRAHTQSPSFERMDFILRYFRRLFITVVSYCRARERSVKKRGGICQKKIGGETIKNAARLIIKNNHRAEYELVYF